MSTYSKTRSKVTGGISGNDGNGYKQMFWHKFETAQPVKQMGNVMGKMKGPSGKAGAKRGIAGGGCGCNH